MRALRAAEGGEKAAVAPAAEHDTLLIDVAGGDGRVDEREDVGVLGCSCCAVDGGGVVVAAAGVAAVVWGWDARFPLRGAAGEGVG